MAQCVIVATLVQEIHACNADTPNRFHRNRGARGACDGSVSSTLRPMSGDDAVERRSGRCRGRPRCWTALRDFSRLVGENVQLVHTDEAVAENVPAHGGPLVDALAAGESTGHMSTNSSCCVTGCVNPCVRFAWESSALILWGGDVI